MSTGRFPALGRTPIPPGAPGRRGPWRQALARFRRQPLGVGALLILLFFFVVGLLAGRIAPYSAGSEFVEFINKPQPLFTPHHWLGTDVIGHDFLTQMLFAIHETLGASLLCAPGAALLGAVTGALAGYYGGVFDAVLTFVSAALWSVPAVAILLIVVIFSKFPVTPAQFAFYLLLYLWPGVARVVRAQFIALRDREFVEAAHAAGASGPRVILRHLLPNSSGPLIVAMSALVGQSIIIIATVDFLGWGTEQVEKPTLGSLIADAARGTGYAAAPWWLYVIPAVTLALLLACVNLVGDALDEAFNPAGGRS
jgi:peptide/nickel transport system permease protein